MPFDFFYLKNSKPVRVLQADSHVRSKHRHKKRACELDRRKRNHEKKELFPSSCARAGTSARARACARARARAGTGTSARACARARARARICSRARARACARARARACAHARTCAHARACARACIVRVNQPAFTVRIIPAQRLHLYKHVFRVPMFGVAVLQTGAASRVDSFNISGALRAHQSVGRPAYGTSLCMFPLAILFAPASISIPCV